MAAPASSSMFLRHANAFRLLSLRSDIDNIILELLGQFSLEKIYCEADKDTYQHLVMNLLVQLNAIFNVQRLTLPSENLQVGWYLGFLASWEVTLRAVEFVLQVVVEGRESLLEARLMREKYLAELLLNTLRFLTLHPKVPTNQKAKDRRDRFARIHRSLECVFDSYPGPESFLLLVCIEVTDSLRTDPNGLALPPRLRSELPNLATELYPLADCLSSQYVSTVVPSDGFSGDWLPQFLALRDISHFVLGASVQYTVNRETRDVRLQTSSARTRNAVLNALENIRMPPHLSKVDLVTTFSDIFRIILPDTLRSGRLNSSEDGEYEIDAIDGLCARLLDRQVVNRVSDREMMYSISEITRNIALLNDPSGQFRAARPKIYAFNCQRCHLVGDSQLRNDENLGFPVCLLIQFYLASLCVVVARNAHDNKEGSELISLPPKSKCSQCSEAVTMLREITLARGIWDLLKPLESNADTINVARHLQTQFQLAPPKLDAGIQFHPVFANPIATQKPIGPDSSTYPPGRSVFSGSMSPDRSRTSLPQAFVSPGSPGFRRGIDTPRTEFIPSEDFASGDGLGFIDTPRTATGDFPRNIPTVTEEWPTSPSITTRARLHSTSNVSFDSESLSRRGMVPLVAPPEKGMSKWRSKLSGSKKESSRTSGESSSISSTTTLESQKVEEIPLKNLISGHKLPGKGKGAKNVNVSLSQNSTYVLLWTQASINVWDIGASSPILGRAITADSMIILAAVTKIHLAYIIGTRDQKLTLRIVNLMQTSVPVVEYRMPSLPWSQSLCISPKENYVVVGFDNATVRFFKTTMSEEPREDHLHMRYHQDCKACPSVDTLSFSNDGLVLLASTRSPKTGTVQLYSWHFPFEEFQELIPCRYPIPLHESEDNGVSSAIFRPGTAGEENLICVTTWTMSGVPVLFQPSDGLRSEIRTDPAGHQGKLGNRIQCASFSPSGRELAIVNNKGHLYLISSLNSRPLELRRIATSKELTIKSDSFAIAFMTVADDDSIVLAWTDPSKCMAYIKKVPVKYNGNFDIPMTPLTPALQATPRYELPSEGREIPKQPVELNVNEIPAPLNIIKGGKKGDW